MTRLPTFLVIGATKCGTESLHRYLSDHPDVFMHPTKELRFFTEHNWGRGVDWYRAQFSAAGSARAVGEASNGYARHPIYGGVPERIQGLLPDVRMVYMIRHPMKRIESHYRHRLVTGVEWREPDAAIRQDPSYVAVSRYGSQLKRYLRCFPRERILTLRLEDLVLDPETTLGRLCRFLDVAKVPGAGFPRLNVTEERAVTPGLIRNLSRFPAARPYVKKASRRLRRSRARPAHPGSEHPFDLSPPTRDKLAEIFREDLALLSEILGEPFDDWNLEASTVLDS